MLYSPAAKQSAPMGTRSTCITERRIHAWRLQPEAFVACWRGWTLTHDLARRTLCRPDCEGSRMSITKQDWPNWLPHMLWIHRQCPRCASVKFKPAETRPFDELLSMFAVRPI